MLQLALLNSIAPKLRFIRFEGLDAHIRNWFTDGYRASMPGTAMCKTNTDCEADEICQSGYCTGLQRKTNVQGIYYGEDERNLLQSTTPYSQLQLQTNEFRFNENGSPFSHPPIQTHAYKRDYEYDHDFA